MHKNIDFLGRALQGAWQRNSAIAPNIANVNTPGYKRVTVNFEDALRAEMDLAAMRTTNPRHIRSTSFLETGEQTIRSTAHRVDGNNVNIDVENAELAKNSIYYNVLTNQANAQIARIKTALKITK